MNKIYSAIIILISVISCAEKEEITGIETIPECKQLPSYLPQSGLDPKTTGFSTSVKQKPGLHLVDVSNLEKRWQHPSWSNTGALGPVVLDENGNAYVVPIPSVNTLNNYADLQNNIYKVDGKTGQLKLLCKLEKFGDSSIKNPFGLIGIIYDCENHLLYASTVYGSLPNDEKGAIFCINPETGEVLDVLKNTDAMGLGIGKLNNRKRLFWGSARNSDLWSIVLDDEGKFANNKRKEMSLAGKGPRGDDRIRKIRFTTEGKLQLYGVEFYFNLIAPTEKQESIYYYIYDATDNGEWKLEKVVSDNVQLGY